LVLLLRIPEPRELLGADDFQLLQHLSEALRRRGRGLPLRGVRKLVL
jgi:hypothetical protein